MEKMTVPVTTGGNSHLILLTKENRDGAADDLAAQQRAKAKARGTHGLQGREERERNAHDDGQATANATERSEGLKGRIDCRKNKGDLNDVGALLAVKAIDAGHDDRRGDNAGERCQHVLKSTRDHFLYRGLAFTSKQGFSAVRYRLLGHLTTNPRNRIFASRRLF